MWRQSLINLDQHDKDAFEITYGLEIIHIKIVYVYNLGILCCLESFGMDSENNIPVYHIWIFNDFLMISDLFSVCLEIGFILFYLD